MFAIDVRTNCEAVAIAPKAKTVELRNVATGEVTTESYDKLVLSPGAASIRPPLPGHRPARDLPGEDRAGRADDPRVDRARHVVPRRGCTTTPGSSSSSRARRAVVIGGGFIGLETAENLVHAGFEVTLVEMLDQVLAPLDREFARLVEGHL